MRGLLRESGRDSPDLGVHYRGIRERLNNGNSATDGKVHETHETVHDPQVVRTIRPVEEELAIC